MAEILNKSLGQFHTKIQNFQRSQESADKIQVLVLGVGRYHADPASSTLIGVSSQELYDVLLCDGTYQIKCLLHPSLNTLVHTFQVGAGCVVSVAVSDCKLQYDETSLTTARFVVIRNLTCLGPPRHRLDLDEVRYCDSCSSAERSAGPLVASRGAYLPLFHSQDPFVGEDLEVVDDDLSERIDYSIVGRVAEVNRSWKRMRRADYPPLVLRVMSRSRWRYYGKTCKIDKWPCQCYLEVADQSGSCSLVLWNAMCPRFYTRLAVGEVVHIQNYTVQARFQQMSRASSRDPDVTSHDIELCVNAHHPRAQVKILREDGLPANIRLPRLKHKFFSRRDASSLPGDFNCDIMGVVTYVGRHQRLRKEKTEAAEFWLYRWVELVDGSSPQPFRVELFSTSQVELNDSVAPGKLLICTQMRLVHPLTRLHTSRDRRTHYFTTTNESQVWCYSLDDIQGRSSSCQQAKTTLNWARSIQGQRLAAQLSRAGGYYDYPRLEPDLNQYLANHEVTVMSFEEAGEAVSKLHYREFKRLHVQAFITHVQYVPPTSAKHGVTEGEESEMSDGDTDSASLHTLRSGKRLKHHMAHAQRRKTIKEVSVTIAADHNALLRDLDLMDTYTEQSNILSRHCHEKDEALLVGTVHIPHDTYEPNAEQNQAKFEELPVVDSGGHLLITLVGLNKTRLIRAILLLPPSLPANLSIMQLLSGQYLSDTPTLPAQGPITTTMNSGANNVNGVTSAIMTPQSTVSRKAEKAVKDILAKPLEQIRNQRMLCVLDVFSAGSENFEIVLNRAYALHDT